MHLTESCMSTLRGALYAYGDMKTLAAYTGVSASSLYKIRSGKTKWPHRATWETLMITLGYRLELVKA